MEIPSGDDWSLKSVQSSTYEKLEDHNVETDDLQKME